MGIDIYISNHTLKKWFLSIISDVNLPHDYVVHSNLESLYSTLLSVKSKRVVLLDIEDNASIEYFNSILIGFSNVNLIAIGLNKPILDILKYIRLGFKGFIDLDYTSIEVFQIINKAMKGLKYLSITQQDHLLEQLSENSENIINKTNNYINGEIKNATKALTEKERRVCELLLKGMTYKEIASAIGVTSFTINQRVKGIYKKLDVRSRGELSYRYLS